MSERAIEAAGGRKTWLILREPGKVPERKGAFPHSNIVSVLREFMKARPTAYITVLTWNGNEPDVQDGPECLEMADGRSSSIASRHRASTRAALAAADRVAGEPYCPNCDCGVCERVGKARRAAALALSPSKVSEELPKEKGWGDQIKNAAARHVLNNVIVPQVEPHDQREPESKKWKAGDEVRFAKTGTLKSPTNEKEPSGLWWVEIPGAVNLGTVHEDEFTPVWRDGAAITEGQLEDAIFAAQERNRGFEAAHRGHAQEAAKAAFAVAQAACVSPGKGEGWPSEEAIARAIASTRGNGPWATWIPAAKAIRALPSPPISSRAEDS